MLKFSTYDHLRTKYGDWPIRTRYCNTSCAQAEAISSFFTKWLKRKFWSSLKEDKQKVWFFLDSNLKTFSWHNVCVTVRDWENDRRADIIHFEKKPPKKKHVLRLQKHSLRFKFLYSLHSNVLFCISALVHKAASTNVQLNVLFLTNNLIWMIQ